MKDGKPSLWKRLNLPQIDPRRVDIALTLLARGGLIGLVLFVAIDHGIPVGYRLDAVIYLVALMWCYLDGMAARGHWRVAVVEAIFLYLISIRAGDLLLTINALFNVPVT